jgi:hypothetical protein
VPGTGSDNRTGGGYPSPRYCAAEGLSLETAGCRRPVPRT